MQKIQLNVIVCFVFNVKRLNSSQYASTAELDGDKKASRIQALLKKPKAEVKSNRTRSFAEWKVIGHAVRLQVCLVLFTQGFMRDRKLLTALRSLPGGGIKDRYVL